MMVAKGRIELKVTAEQWFDYATQKTGIHLFELTPKIAVESCELPGSFHGDPADRIIVATINGTSMQSCFIAKNGCDSR